MLWRAAIGAACHFLLSFVGVLILMNFKSDGEELLGGVKTIQDVTAALCLFLVPKVVHVSISLRDDLPFITYTAAAVCESELQKPIIPVVPFK